MAAPMYVLWLVVTCFLCSSLGLDNGLARMPPLGWISSERFMCNTDCVNYPADCISESLVKSTADAMVASGFLKYGYNYVILDDCWQAKSRDKDGRLIADPSRFPSGMKSLADYVHSKGLRFGLYLNTENTTCNGYPGSQGKMQTDASTLTNWGVDMVKVDSCGVQHTSALDQAYAEFQKYFNKTGRPVLFMCTYPVYQRGHGIQIDYAKVMKTCNIFKESDDMKDSWIDLEKTVKYFGDKGSGLLNYSRPGSWSYTNPILVGDYGLSPDQQRIQVALWSMMASPLLISADVREKRPEFKDLLMNPRVLAISQDPLGIMGKRVLVAGQVKVWIRLIMPRGSFSLALVYTNVSGGPSKVTLKLRDVGMVTAAAYLFVEVFSGRHIGVYKPWHTFNSENGQVYMWMRPIQPQGSFALAIWYVNISGSPKKFSIKLQDIGMTTAAAYHFYDVFSGNSMGIYKPWYTFDAEINPTGVLFINATALG